MFFPCDQKINENKIINGFVCNVFEFNVPSSWVRTVMGKEAGPSPTEVPARTQMRYCVQRLSSSRTKLVAFSLLTEASLSERSASTKCSL